MALKSKYQNNSSSLPSNLLTCEEKGIGKCVYQEREGIYVCPNCNIEKKEQSINQGPEWRAFDDEQKAKRTRVGSPSTYTMHDKGLSTVIELPFSESVQVIDSWNNVAVDLLNKLDNTLWKGV